MLMQPNPAKRSIPTGAVNLGKRHAIFVLIVVGCAALYAKPLSALLALCLHADSYSHILLIPFITLYLIFSERNRIFQGTYSSILWGAAVILVGLAISLVANRNFYMIGGEHLSATILGFVFACTGAFLACYGTRAARAAFFPLLFMLLMVPLPEVILSRVITVLQRGSVEVSFLLFKIFGVPVLRRGVLLSVPGVTIEVAKECSSIRSSMALFITCILAARFYLRSFWKQLLFVALSLPLSVIKNGIRITTLTLLSIYVDPGFLHGELHRDGGFVFFFLALVLLWPVLVGLRRSETVGGLRASEIGPGSEPVGG
jgi:exosortase